MTTWSDKAPAPEAVHAHSNYWIDREQERIVAALHQQLERLPLT
ncbi:hypothetical protein OIE68_12005 [Nocardia vinacea]|uniref:Uncharacterized protein n=1 Tax=Nocardia vinacea TaxID=96468 RepID=A0ABZ1YSF5_9NOCA|nr:hypothetical protein OIE68_12005 [Nocardia vinacea]